MKIIVLSDSHGSSFDILKALKKHPAADAAIFLGDGADDFFLNKPRFPDIAFLAVLGNWDIGRGDKYGLRAAEEITLEGKKIFFCHGNTYGVKWGLGNIISAAKSRGADIALFGHTHAPLEKYIPADEAGGALYLVNPGSVGRDSHTFAVITVKDGNVLVSHGKV